MRFIDVAIPKFSGDSPQPSRPAVAAQPRPSFRPQPIEEYILDDNKSIASLATHDEREHAKEDDGSEKGGDMFYEAPDDTTEVSRVGIPGLTVRPSAAPSVKSPLSSHSLLANCKHLYIVRPPPPSRSTLPTLHWKVLASPSLCVSMICRSICSCVMLHWR